MEWSEVQRGHNPDMSKHASDTHVLHIQIQLKAKKIVRDPEAVYLHNMI